MYKGAIYEDYTKDQFMMHVKRTNPMGDTACSCMYLCRVSSEGSMSCTKDQFYGISTRTSSSCQKEYLYRGFVQQGYVQQYREKTQRVQKAW